MFRWNLTKPTDNKPVGADFLVASLANWVRTGSRSRSVRDYLDGLPKPRSSFEANDWMVAAYDKLYRGDKSLNTVISSAPFPPETDKGEREILTVEQVLKL